MVDLSKYDFVDFGAGHGGCFEFARKRLGGRKGLGIDYRPSSIIELKAKGYDCLQQDITKIVLPRKSVRFITMSHVLEHLPSIEAVKNVIKLAVNTATDFVFVEGPSFDFDSYLKDFNLKFFWSDGCGHKTKVKISDLKNIFRKLNVKNYDFLVEIPLLKNATSNDIIPYSVPKKYSIKYDPMVHPPKKLLSFDKKVFRSFIVYIWLTDVKKALLKTRVKFKQCAFV